MDINKLTQKTQDALDAAQALALQSGHQEVDSEHLLIELLRQEDGLVPRLLKRMDVAPEALEQALLAELDKRPKVSGPGYEQGKIYVARPLAKALTAAEQSAKRMKDDYVSVEHVLMA